MSMSDARKRLMDHTYAVRYENRKWMVGNSKLDIDSNDDFIINGIRYKGTLGLYELMFMRKPEKGTCTVNDEKV